MRLRNRFRDDAEPVPTAPMADITFLLIIFFMVSTVFDVSRGIRLRLPTTVTQQRISDRAVTVAIDAAEAVYVDGERIELGGLGAAVRGRLEARPEGYVLIKSDEGVRYRRVVAVLDELRLAGIADIALPTAPAAE